MKTLLRIMAMHNLDNFIHLTISPYHLHLLFDVTILHQHYYSTVIPSVSDFTIPSHLSQKLFPPILSYQFLLSVLFFREAIVTVQVTMVCHLTTTIMMKQIWYVVDVI